MAETRDKVVLVVDDMATIRAAMAHHLKTAGYKTLEAESGAAALQIAFRQPPDLILLDVMMPKLDGFAVLEKLKSEPGTAKIPVVLCTAKGLREDVLKANQLGADDYIVKPFSKQTVLDKVKKLIGEPPPPPPKEKKPKPVPAKATAPAGKPGEKPEAAPAKGAAEAKPAVPAPAPTPDKPETPAKS